MNIFAWVIFGLIVGTIANILDPRPNFAGVLSSLILGVVGAVVGGFVAGFIFSASLGGFDIQTLIVAVLGSLLVLVLQRLMLSRI